MSRKKNIEFELLRTFISVVDNGSITRASKQIHRTQSAISMQIKRLEEQVGQRLFDRTGRQLELTYKGKNLVAYARRLLNLHDEAVNEVIESEQKEQHITVGCPDDYSASILPLVMNVLYQHQDKLHITVVTENSPVLRRKLDENDIDLAILSRLPESNEGVVINQVSGVWLGQNTSSFTQRPLPLVLFEPNCKFHSSVIDGLEKSDIDYSLMCDASQTGLMISLVRSNNYIAVVPDVSIPDDLIGLRVIDGLPELPVGDIAICLPGANQSILGLSLKEIAKRIKC